jgi:hypothetical protein
MTFEPVSRANMRSPERPSFVSAPRGDERASFSPPLPSSSASLPHAGSRPRAIVPRTLEETMHIAKAVHAARMAPKGMDTPEQCMVAILHGLEVGLTPLAALQRIAVVNGRPTIWGDGALALVRASGLAERIGERIEGEGPAQWNAVCEVLRRGEAEPVVRTFSVEDAKRARLWGKAGPWTDYPRRMLQMRARAFALRDAFADVLGGLYLREEIEEEPRRVHVLKAEIGPVREMTTVHQDAPLEGISEEELDARENALEARDGERKGVSASSENLASVPPLPPMRSLELRRRMTKEASRLRFRNGWSIRQPKSLRPPVIGEARDPRRTNERPPTDEDAHRADPDHASKEEDARWAVPDDMWKKEDAHWAMRSDQCAHGAGKATTSAHRATPLGSREFSAFDQDRAAVIDLFDDALACARDPDTLSEIVEEFASRLNDLPRDTRLSADIVIARHEKRIATANETVGGTTDTAASERGTTP